MRQHAGWGAATRVPSTPILKFILKLVQAVLSAAGSVALALIGIDRPAGFWDHGHHRPIFVASFVVVAGSAVFAPVAEGLRARNKAERLAYKALVDEVLIAGLVRVHETANIPLPQLGAHAFFVRSRPFPQFWRPELRKEGSFRHNARRRSGRIIWTEGKGVIGYCWQEQEGVVCDVSANAAAAKAMTAAEFDAIPPEDRLNMSHADYQRTSTYGTIIAWPIFNNGGTFKGCVSVDCSSGLVGALDTPPIHRVLEDMARSVWLVDRAPRDA